MSRLPQAAGGESSGVVGITSTCASVSGDVAAVVGADSPTQASVSGGKAAAVDGETSRVAGYTAASSGLCWRRAC